MVLNDTLSQFYLIPFSLQDFILEHYGEESYLYEDEIADLMDLRQVRFCKQQGGAGGGWSSSLQSISLLHFKSHSIAGGWAVYSSVPLVT